MTPFCRLFCIVLTLHVAVFPLQANAFTSPQSRSSSSRHTQRTNERQPRLSNLDFRGGDMDITTSTTSTSLNGLRTSAAAKVAAAAAATAASATLPLPAAKTILATTFLPTCIGYYKYEYGVSYAYGTATSVTSFLILRSLLSLPASPFATMAQIHAAAIVFYGARLNLFLLYREVFLERFRRMRERIEERQSNKESQANLISRFTSRTPFILSCAALYAGLASPALIGGMLAQQGAGAITIDTTTIPYMAYKVLVGLTWFGFSLGALGDFTKSFMKARKGPDHLVTGGVFSLFRHPNYTGEVIGWTSSSLASIAAILCANGVTLKSLAWPLVLNFSGVLGIIFVLCAATANLEKRQKEKYEQTDTYKKWISSSWAGFQLKPKPDEENE